MKCLSFGVVLVSLVLVSCQPARAQRVPPVVVVPTDELSSDPSLKQPPAFQGSPSSQPQVSAPPQTSAQAESSAQPQASPPPSASDYASVPQPTPAAVVPERHSYTSCNVPGMYIAMTFDDGPSAQLTPKLLDILKERGIKATFFLVGKNVAEYPDIVRRMVDEGHEV
ncbi:MAG TPA: polysaccharide deacetylase family protein, partial [Terrimicrobiaceae bacterium]|nr:polysaccharide deacetylase family protein [Terrimicrobiaceae bacterium]